MKINIPSDVKLLLEILHNNCFEAYIVGGCVRDSIMGRIPHDWDICTNAAPDKIKGCFSNFKIIETGQKHGTIGVKIENEVYEITTYRIDGEYLDLRRPSRVFFTDNLKHDLSRRDFTVNALAYNEKEGIIDFFGGINDIFNKIIKCVGDPQKRFNEDALRILRALRLSSELGFNIEKNTSDAMFENKNLLFNIAAERINTEFNRLITTQHSSDILRNYINIIKVFIPEIANLSDNTLNDLWENTLRSIEISKPDLIIRLFFLLKELCNVQSILKRLKYDNITVVEVCKLINNFKVGIQSSPQNIKILLNKLGEKTLRQIILIRCIDNLIKGQSIGYYLTIEKMLNDIIEKKQCFRLKDLNINGEDLINMGIKEGKEVGYALNKLLYMVISDLIENKREELLETAKQII